jgi:diguanylate cyclase (GGDEF)-like protein
LDATGKMLKVLAVEDSDDDFELIRNELTEGGFTVVCERVETAVSLRVSLEHKPWDIVICDHNLPALDSLSALKMVREVSENLPFIIVSGLIPDEVAIEAMRRGARDFICKDNLSKLVPVVERELREALIRADLKAAQESLHNVSYFDSLTGCKSRLVRGSQGEDVLRCVPLAVFWLILTASESDQIAGLWAGNKVLVETAERLCMVFGEKVFVARLGADTFVAVVPHLNQEARAGDIAKAIHKCMDESFQIDEHDLFVNASVGVSFYPKDGQKWDDLFRNAESALYNAKATGGSSYQTYRPEMDIYGRERLVMESASIMLWRKKISCFIISPNSIFAAVKLSARKRCFVGVSVVSQN